MSPWRSVRQPRAAAVAGLAFGLILSSVLVLLHSAAPGSTAESGSWVTDLERREAVSTALALIPFAGIAFLWFIAVVRSSLGGREDRFFDTVFTGSGLVFVAMLFAAAAVLLSSLSLADAGVVRDPAADAEAWALAAALLGSFGARMAAVFTPRAGPTTRPSATSPGPGRTRRPPARWCRCPRGRRGRRRARRAAARRSSPRWRS
jgi:hypothetical protein